MPDLMVNLVVVHRPFAGPDSLEEIHPGCAVADDVVISQITDEIPNTHRCDRCRKHTGKFTVEGLLDADGYEALVDKLMHLDGEDLVNVVSRALQLRGDVKQPSVVGTSDGHYEQASILHYTPRAAEDGHTYPPRAFEIVVMERDVRKVPEHLLSN